MLVRRVVGVGDLRVYDVRALVNVSRLRGDFARMRPDAEYRNSYLRTSGSDNYVATNTSSEMTWTPLEPAMFARSLDVFLESASFHSKKCIVSVSACRRTPAAAVGFRSSIRPEDDAMSGVLCIARDHDAIGAVLSITAHDVAADFGGRGGGESSSIELPPGHLAVFGSNRGRVDCSISRVEAGSVDTYIFSVHSTNDAEYT